LWENGNFEFKEATLNLNWLVVIRLNILMLLLDASRRVDTLSVLKKHIQSDSIIFKIAESSGKKEEKKLNQNELTILSLVDGRRSVRQIINKSTYEDFSVYKILYSFISTGLIVSTDYP